jgi:hypothetical protein
MESNTWLDRAACVVGSIYCLWIIVEGLASCSAR